MKLLFKHSPDFFSSAKHGNAFDYTRVKQLQGETKFRNIGLRYVSEGMETYRVNGHSYDVRAGQYLVVNHHQGGAKLHVDTNEYSYGICMDINPEIVTEVVGGHLRPDLTHWDPDLENFFTTPQFLEQYHPGGKTRLGAFFQAANIMLKQGNLFEEAEQNEFYFRAAELLLEDSVVISKHLQQIKVVKAITKRELYQRIVKGRNLICDNYARPITMPMIAREVGMSEYHFFRMFRQVYRMSPHQFLASRRTEAAQTALLKTDITFSELALNTGFADVFSFSKAFKKATGMAPSNWKLKHKTSL